MAQICFKEPSKSFFIRLMSASFMAWVFSKINGHGWEMKYWATRWATVKILCPETAANKIWTIQLDHGSLHLPRMLTPQKVTFCCTEYKTWVTLAQNKPWKWPLFIGKCYNFFLLVKQMCTLYGFHFECLCTPWLIEWIMGHCGPLSGPNLFQRTIEVIFH